MYKYVSDFYQQWSLLSNTSFSQTVRRHLAAHVILSAPAEALPVQFITALGPGPVTINSATQALAAGRIKFPSGRALPTLLLAPAACSPAATAASVASGLLLLLQAPERTTWVHFACTASLGCAPLLRAHLLLLLLPLPVCRCCCRLLEG
jgi:hypothetical protein